VVGSHAFVNVSFGLIEALRKAREEVLAIIEDN